jgi:hypothetical protein
MESSSFEFGLSDGWMDRMLSSQYDLDALELWIEKTSVEMERYRTILESNDTGTHSAERSFWDTAPCTSPSLAYLTVVPVSQASDISLVQVLHVICDVPSSRPPHTVTCGGIGDSQPPFMPLIKEAPMNGLETYFDKSEVAWPSTERMKEFYKTHSSAELMEKDKAEEKAGIPELMFVPTTWIGAFLSPNPPQVAYERATWMKSLLPKDYTHLDHIQMIIAWTRVACVKRRGRGNPNSQMTIPWRVMPDDQIARRGAENRLSDMYPRKFPKHTTSKQRRR